MRNQPTIVNGYERVPVAPVMVESDIGEDREVGTYLSALGRQLHEPNIGDGVPHDARPGRLNRCLACGAACLVAARGTAT